MGGASDITLARTFGTWAASLKSVDIPADVVTAARRAILDTVGVLAAGAVHSATGHVAAAFGHAPDGCRRVDGLVS